MLLRLRERMRRDRGSTIVPVIGLVAVAGILTVLIASATVHAVSFTTLTRAGVQAQAAADAGVEFMRAQLAAGTCPAGNKITKTYSQAFSGPGGTAELARLGIDGSRPYFEVTVEHQQLISGILTGGWSAGCPSGLLGILTFQVRILSTGHASSPGVAGASALDEHTVEVIHGWTLAPPTPTIAASGPAVYSHGMVGLNSNTEFISFAGSHPNVLVKQGNLVCDSNTEGIADVVTDNGQVLIQSNCRVDGSVWAAGSVTVRGNAVIGGNVVASGVTLENNSRVRGSVWSSGSISGGAGRIDGVANANVSAGAMPPRPAVPEWHDLGYVPADWTGFTVATMSGSCTASALRSVVGAATGPLIVDARSCSSGIVIGTNEVVTLSKDTAIFANRFTLGSNAEFTAATSLRLWLIQPDNFKPLLGLTAPKPECNAVLLGADRPATTLQSNFTVQSPIETMIYSPCGVVLESNVKIDGQIYARTVTLSSNTELTYIPVGLPGVNLDTGGAGGLLPSLGSLGSLVYYRDVTG